MSFSPKQRFLTLLIILSGVMGVFASDMYVPSLPAIADAFSVSSRWVELTVAWYLFALAGSQLIYGPVSDKFGRRHILLFGLAVMVFGSLLCALAGSITSLIAARFIQGLGAGACLALARAITRDSFSGSDLAYVGSIFSLFAGFIPCVAPVLGGYFQHYLGWQSVFAFLALYSFVVWWLVYKGLPETHQPQSEHSLRISKVLANYAMLLRSRAFMGHVLSAAMAVSGILVYYTMSPFLLQNVLGLSPVAYGWLVLVVAGAMLFSRVANIYLAKKWSKEYLVVLGNGLMLAGAVIMLALGLFGVLTLSAVVLPMIIYISGTAFIFSNAMAGALQGFPEKAGSAGALYGCIQIGCPFIFTSIAAHLHENNQNMLALMLVIISAIASLSFYALVFSAKQSNIAEAGAL